MLTFYHASWSRSGRIMWLLEELGADFEIVQVDIERPQFGVGARDPRNPHPDGKVPALRDGDALVTESAAVALYLTERFPQPNLGADPGSAERGAFLSWIAWVAGELEPAVWSRMEPGGRNPIADRRFEAVRRRLSDALSRGPWLMGDRFTAVDVMVASTLAWAREHLPEDAALDAYLERATARPANAWAMAKDGPPPQLPQT
ncbi:MAG TPA: glutathione S-transferase family protein [Brevundimonas sp.]|jgi:glutathione S-transferase|uniref:glutathione S-transferase family protein n=1 Tax=Brevundimonas sp. TaxID=1871086 RepID=UPI002DF0D329|nr:glutathione S-transferase family protein [Brevundimonas sp.]